MKKLLAMLAVVFVTVHAARAGATPPAGFGNQWVRDHPFTLKGLNIFAANLDVGEYRGAGFNTLLAWEEVAQQTAIAAAGGLTWHAHIRPANQGPDTYLQNLVNSAAANAGGLGWLLHDEPGYLHMAGIGSAATWIRQNYPGMPVYSNAFPSYASAAQLYGDGSKPGYTYDAYLDDFIAIIEPDILMYDHYPFEAGGDTTKGFYSDLMVVRSKALAANIPYWTFIQSWANAGSRLPSESDLRMHIFTHLAAGYSGLSYFTYDRWDDGGLLDAAGAPTPLYYLAADVNAEVLNLAGSLRFLTSTGVRYLRGQYKFLGISLQDNPVPRGMTTWTAGSGGDTHITGADVDTSDQANYGEGKDGVIGFFSDDAGRRYFMLVNAWHAAGTSAASAALPFYVQFDASVDALLELDRDTGEQVLVPLTNNRLEVTLLGGSGRLYKYNDGPFAPATGPGPDAGVDGGMPGGDAGSFDGGASGGDGGASGGDGGSGADSGGGPAADGDGQGGCGCESSPEPSGAFLLLLLGGWLLRRQPTDTPRARRPARGA